MNPSVVIASHAAHLALSRPGSQYEDKWLPGRMPARGGRHFFAFFANKSKSPGRCGALSWRLPFSRRQAVGVVAYLNTGTLTAVNSRGVLRHWSSNPRFKFLQEPSRGLSKSFEVLFCMFAHVEQRSSEGLQGVVRA